LGASVATPTNPESHCGFPRQCEEEDEVIEQVFMCGACEQGYYCGGGRGTMNPCPRGTFGERDRLQFSGQCTNCTGGFYCIGVGRMNVSGPCSPGFYCTGGSQSPNPDGTQGWGGECSPGYFCPEGSSFETACMAGSYANISGKAECDECPAGYYCPEVTISPQECEPGYYCPNGTGDYTQNECPAGTYNDQTKGKTLDDCIQCPVGKFVQITFSNTWITYYKICVFDNCHTPLFP